VHNYFGILDKDRELAEAYADIKALKHTERLTEKAYEEVNPLLNTLSQLHGKFISLKLVRGNNSCPPHHFLVSGSFTEMRKDNE
jgi:hypothetical protein